MNFVTQIHLSKHLIVLTLSVCFSGSMLSADLKSAMEKYSIIPDVLDNVPKNILEVKYPSGDQVNLGNELSSTSVMDIPLVKWPIETDELYALAMLDIDVFNKPKSTRDKHWLVINIPGLAVDKGETLVEYVGSDPQKDSGAHRYVFVVYKQQFRIEISDMRPLFGKMKDQIKEFTDKYSMEELIATNFFQTQFDN